MRYLITFVCYGARLHGDERGSVDRGHNLPRTRFAEGDPDRLDAKRELMDQPPYHLDSTRRAAVLEAIREVCSHRQWDLIAAHIRTNHVHVVVEANVAPEKAMLAFKSYASRALNRRGLDQPNRKRWARHGSTRWLRKDQNVEDAIRYVVSEQGEPMAVHLSRRC